MLAPDLMLETRTPNNTKCGVSAKAVLWLELDVKRVWKLDTKMRFLTTYRTNQAPRSLGERDILDGEEILSGLSVSVPRLFR